jgi:hypothetical protein
MRIEPDIWMQVKRSALDHNLKISDFAETALLREIQRNQR